MRLHKNRTKGTGTIEKKRGHFYLKIRINGKTKSTLLLGKNDQPVTTKADAESAAALLLPVLRAQQKEEIALYVANARKLRNEESVPIEQIWPLYLKQYTRPNSSRGTLESYESSLRHFVVWLDKEHPEIHRVNQIDPDIAGAYFSFLWNERKVSGRTFNCYRQALKLIFTHILEPVGLDENPFARITGKPIDTESREAFTEEQVKKIFSGFQTGFFYETEVARLGPGRKPMMVKKTLCFEPMFKDEMYVLMMLCCWTGCRGQDGCLMRWSNVDMEQGILTYVPQKTARKTKHRSVTLPLHPELAEALEYAKSFRNRNREHDDFIIPSVAARYQYNPGGVQADVLKIIRCATGEATTAAECSEHRVHRANRYSLHSFRHTFVSFCANAGVPLDVVASIVGHSSSDMTRHYAHISDEAKRNAIKTLPILSESAKPVPDRELLMKKLQNLTDKQVQSLLQKIG